MNKIIGVLGCIVAVYGVGVGLLIGHRYLFMDYVYTGDQCGVAFAHFIFGVLFVIPSIIIYKDK